MSYPNIIFRKHLNGNNSSDVSAIDEDIALTHDHAPASLTAPFKSETTFQKFRKDWEKKYPSWKWDESTQEWILSSPKKTAPKKPKGKTK